MFIIWYSIAYSGIVSYQRFPLWSPKSIIIGVLCSLLPKKGISQLSTLANICQCGCTVYPKKYAHGFCFAVLCCGYTLTDFPISIRLTSLALWQSNDCPSASKAILMNMDKYFMWIHYERLHNHNKAKHNKTVCIFLGIYCLSWPPELGDQKLSNISLTPASIPANFFPCPVLGATGDCITAATGSCCTFSFTFWPALNHHGPHIGRDCILGWSNIGVLVGLNEELIATPPTRDIMSRKGLCNLQMASFSRFHSITIHRW